VPGYLLAAVFRTQYHLKVLRSVDALILPSLFMRALVDVHVPHAPMIEHIPYGIPTANSVNRPRGPSGPVALGYLGAIKPHKGVHLLIEAFSDLQHESAVLHIHGDPTADPAYSNVLRRRCRDSRIHFKGPYDNQKVGSILSQLNALVVPSVWRETGPMVIQEALANGIPVIAADLGGMAELVRPGVNGYLFEPGNKDALCRYMGKILSGSLPLDRLTPCLEAGHTLEHHVASLMRVYGRLTRPMQER
jgi:glycosyltransferase involved in cell wall biosynthesis